MTDGKHHRDLQHKQDRVKVQKMHRQQILEDKLERAIGNDMENDHHLGRHRGHLSGKEPDDHNRDHRNIVEARENTNDLPEPLGSKLQQWRDQ